jgi:hypothetical protein
MKFLKTNINSIILIDDSFFISKKDFYFNNIDHLNNSLSNLNDDSNFDYELPDEFINHDDHLQNKLIIISRAADLAEKFHSFFHFEEAYFHFSYAEFLSNLKENFVEKVIYHFENSIKQFRFNEFVHLKLIQFCQKHQGLDSKINQAILRFESLFGKKFDMSLIQNFEIKRQFDSFEAYVKFAISPSKNYLKIIDHDKIKEFFFKKENFYNQFDKFIFEYEQSLMTNNLELNKDFLMKQGEKSIEMIGFAHKNYHENAARIYYNYSKIYNILGENVKSKNLMIKVKNLNPNFAFDF